MTGIDTANSHTVNSTTVSEIENELASPPMSASQPSADAVSAFEAMVGDETDPAGEANTTAPEDGTTLEEIRENIRDQIIRDIITKQTTFQI